MATTTGTAADELARILKGHADYLHALDRVLQADTLADVPRATWERLDDDPDNYDAGDTGWNVFTRWLDQDTLSVSVLIDRNGPEYGHTVRVLVECGGPRVEYRRDHDDGEMVEVLATWSPETGTRRVWAARVAEALDQVAGPF